MALLAVKEEIILSGLLILGGHAHGSPLRNKVIELSGKDIVYGTLYNLLEVLIRKGYVVSEKTGPLPVPGGRSKSLYRITPKGRKELSETLMKHEEIIKSVAETELEI